jgi:hypothetical protein
MAYEMRDNSFQAEFSPENVDQKHPAFKATIKQNGKESDVAVWAKNGKYGMQLYGDATKLSAFMRALFGRTEPPKQAPAADQKKQTPPPAEKPEERATLLR